MRLNLELATRMWKSLAVEARGLESRAAITEIDACFRWFDSLVSPPSERRAPPPYAATLFSPAAGAGSGAQTGHAVQKELSYLLDSAVTEFFTNTILKLDPALLTPNGFWYCTYCLLFCFSVLYLTLMQYIFLNLIYEIKWLVLRSRVYACLDYLCGSALLTRDLSFVTLWAIKLKTMTARDSLIIRI